VCARYRAKLPQVLHGVSFEAKGGEFVGIVGRTGSGKSTLVNLLFRLLAVDEPPKPSCCGTCPRDRPTRGRILLDDVDIAQVPLQRLRSALCVIPQDPFLFTGSVRFNLDPFGRSSDEQLWNVLQQVGIDDRVRSEEGGLDAGVVDGGRNYSVGERQLLCLARAMLKGGCKVVLMDEASASVDKATDARIQAVVRTFFRGVTMLTIAHRLRTVIDYDRILVLDAGKVVEFDSPSRLLGTPGGALFQMVEAMGAEEAAALRQVAAEGRQSVVETPATSIVKKGGCCGKC